MIYYARIARVKNRLVVKTRVIKEKSLEDGIESRIEKHHDYIDIYAKTDKIADQLTSQYRPQLSMSAKFVHIRHDDASKGFLATRLLSDKQMALKAAVADLKAKGILW